MIPLVAPPPSNSSGPSPCRRERPARGFLTVFVALALVVGLHLSNSPARAQLPAEAVDLALVKIPELLKSEDLCPVDLVPSAADGERWTHEGVPYRGSRPGVRQQFEAAPERFVDAHRRERWVRNFMAAMSTIWCPITDEVTPGGRKRLDAHGYTWESCCTFCDEDMHPDNVTEALERLRDRAEESYQLTGGQYHDDATSPVEGAIRDDV